MPRVPWHVVVLATLVAPGAQAQTLLQVERASHTLALVDPGSGLKLASIDVAAEPRRVAVSPDGKLAAVLSCVESSTTLSIVDLEHPKELRRVALTTSSCPDSLTWAAADRIAVAAGPAPGGQAIEPATGRNVGELSEGDLAAIENENRRQGTLDLRTVAVQQFLAAGGDVRGLAMTPVVPRAVCHACTPDP
jgi:DNA-binding beta-propeller fold protein YncE